MICNGTGYIHQARGPTSYLYVLSHLCEETDSAVGVYRRRREARRGQQPARTCMRVEAVPLVPA